MKRTRLHRTVSIAVVLTTLVALSGCTGSKPTRYYLLSSKPMDDGTTAVQGLNIGIRPVALAEYLGRSQIVIMDENHQPVISAYDRWAESLDENIGRVLKQNLSVLVPGAGEIVYPWPGKATVDVGVAVAVTQFDMQSDGVVLLIADWSVHTLAAEEPPTKSRSVIRKPVQSEDKKVNYDAVVAAMNAALDELSEEIAAAVPSSGQ